MKLELPETAAMVRADKVQLQQVWINLLRNAIEALQLCPDGPRQIQLSVQAVASHWLIRFRDNGKGLSDEHIAMVFEPYFTDKDKGLGLGLAISRSIIESHGGRIEVASDGRSFSQFEIRLSDFEGERR